MALGTYERIELDYVIRCLRPADTFIDVGAHIGYFTLPVAKRVGPQGRVIAVEPSPGLAKHLLRNVALNGLDWVSVVQAAASGRDGDVTLTVSATSPMWNTLCENTLQGETSVFPVVTRTLDSLVEQLGWPSVAGIKMDVEGMEAEVIRGAIDVLDRNPDAFLLVEISGGVGSRIRASLETLDVLTQRHCRFMRLRSGGVAQPTDIANLKRRLQSPRWQDHLPNVVAERTV